MVIPCHDNLPGFQDEDPAGWFQCLSRFIYYDRIIMQVPYGIMVGTYKRGGDYLGPVNNIPGNVLLGVLSCFENTVSFIKKRLTLLPLGFSKIAFILVRHIDKLCCLLFHLLYFFHAAVFRHFKIQRQRKKSFRYPCWITYPQNVQPFLGEFFTEQVNGRITGRYYEYLFFMPFDKCFNGLYQHSRFASAWRAVNNSKVICGKDLINGYLLRRVEGWNKFRDGLEMKCSGFPAGKNIDDMCVLFF